MDTIGVYCKPNWYSLQKTFFSGHHQTYVIKGLTYCLPNGVTATVYGPCSACQNKRQILNWSDSNNSLVLLSQQILGQLFYHKMYKYYYNSGIAGGGWRYHQTKNCSAPLTKCQIHENKVMKGLCESVEWSYNDVKIYYRVSINCSTFKLESDVYMVYTQIRVIFFFQNCYNCLRGNNTSKFFGLDSPSLNNYLLLHD